MAKEEGGNGGSGDGGQDQRKDVSSRWEWVVGMASTVLVLAVLGYLSYQALTEADTPPLVRVQVDSVMPGASGWLVRFHARNHGSETAAAVTVRGELMQGDSTVQTSETTLDYVPAHAGRHGGLYFDHDPRSMRLELRALGYDAP